MPISQITDLSRIFDLGSLIFIAPEDMGPDQAENHSMSYKQSVPSAEEYPCC